MVFVDDLMRGLVALQFAKESELLEPQRGYTIRGMSFTANELFREIRAHVPEFETTMALNANMDKFARLWPDALAGEASLRDLEYQPRVDLPRMVTEILKAHADRTSQAEKSESTANFSTPELTEVLSNGQRAAA